MKIPIKSKFIVSVILVLLISTNVEAQILKKLKKKAEKALVNKKEDKDSIPEEPTDEPSKEEKKALDNKLMGIFGGGLENLPDTYAFQYVIDMKLTTNKDEMDMQYFVQPNASYFANSVSDEKANSIIVYDMENQAMVTFMDNGKQKMAMKMRMPFDADAQKQLSEQDKGKDGSMKDMSIIPLPEKTILGYRCRGYQVTQKEGVSKIYVTDEAPVSLVGVFSSVSQNMPKNFSSPSIPFNEKSLMMEMEYISNKRKKDNLHMICTQIKEKSFAINKTDYKTGM